MDEYGFIAAARVGLRVFDESQRNTGRSTRLIERTQPGDMIIVSTQQEQRWYERKVKEAKKADVTVLCVDPHSYLPERMNGRRALSNCYFDHVWTSKFVAVRLAEAARELETYERELSTQPSARPSQPVYPPNWRQFG